MPRKLKTYITNLGFFELALAAPSMKAALEAWGMGHNAFHQGFARETDDPRIVAATMARPGVVLKRPVGTKGPFQEKAVLPKDWSVAPPDLAPAKAKAKAKPPLSPRTKPRAKTKADKKERDARADILSFEKEKARRAQAREKAAARDEALREKERAARDKQARKAQAALEKAEARHADIMAAMEKERDRLDRRAGIERERWEKERDRLRTALRAAKA
jgi:hypothetical protein